MSKLAHTDAHVAHLFNKGGRVLRINQHRRGIQLPAVPPPKKLKNHFDPDHDSAVAGLYLEDGGSLVLANDDFRSLATGDVTLWTRNTAFLLKEVSGVAAFNFNSGTGHNVSVPDLNWNEGNKVRVALSYERRLASAPKNVLVSAPQGEDGTLEVSWEASNAESTFPTSHYAVEFHPAGHPRRWVRSSVPSTETSVRRTDPLTGFEYRVFVQALGGDGDESDTKTVVTNGKPASCRLNPGDLWCGVVTVWRGATLFGYDGEFEPDIGALSDDKFDVGTNSYTISENTFNSQTGSTPRALNFVFDSATRPTAADRGKLVRHVGSFAFAFSEVTPHTPIGGRTFRWPTAGLDWSRKEWVIVRLCEASSEDRALRGRFVSPPARTTRTPRGFGRRAGRCCPRAGRAVMSALTRCQRQPRDRWMRAGRRASEGSPAACRRLRTRPRRSDGGACRRNVIPKVTLSVRDCFRTERLSNGIRGFPGDANQLNSSSRSGKVSRGLRAVGLSRDTGLHGCRIGQGASPAGTDGLGSSRLAGNSGQESRRALWPPFSICVSSACGECSPFSLQRALLFATPGSVPSAAPIRALGAPNSLALLQLSRNSSCLSTSCLTRVGMPTRLPLTSGNSICSGCLLHPRVLAGEGTDRRFAGRRTVGGRIPEPKGKPCIRPTYQSA